MRVDFSLQNDIIEKKCYYFSNTKKSNEGWFFMTKNCVVVKYRYLQLDFCFLAK